MDSGSHELLHCPHRTLDLTNMLVSSSKIETDAQKILLDLAKLIVTVNGNDREASCMVKVKYFGKTGAGGLAAVTGHELGGAELYFP